MIIHHFRNKVSSFPVMKTNWKSDRNNTYNNLRDFIQQLKETPQYLMTFDYETGEVQIWFMLNDGRECKVSMYNTINSCTIYIEHILSGQILSSESHYFSPFRFSLFVNSLLTADDIEKQIAFRDQEKLRREALKKAHDAEKCGCCSERCDYCKSEARRHQILHGYGT
jgi:hypothetical protein